MKPPYRLPLIVACLIIGALPASALPEFKDTFTSTKLDKNWKPFSDNGGKLVLNKGKLNLVTPRASQDGASGAVILNIPQASVKESWETEVAVTNSTKTGESWTGLLVGNASSLFSNNLAIEFAQYQGQPTLTSFTAAGGKEKRVAEIPTTAKKIYMRVAYDAKTKICSVYFRTKPRAQWTTLYTYSPFNDAKADFRGNWKLNANTGRFSLALFGGSVDKINAGAVTIDDFVIRNSK
jgi:hypothetical protein